MVFRFLFVWSLELFVWPEKYDYRLILFRTDSTLPASFLFRTRICILGFLLLGALKLFLFFKVFGILGGAVLLCESLV